MNSLNHIVYYPMLKKQVQAIINSFIPNTYLPRYGGGDWDDTLQPANHDLTQKNGQWLDGCFTL